MSKDNSMTRRQLLRRSGVVSGGVLVSQAALSSVAKDAWALASGDGAAGKAAQAMPKRVLGKTGKQIPILLQGGSMPWNTKWDPKLPEAIKHGITYLDAAWVYSGGTNEIAIGSFLERTKMRDKLWITSKSDLHDPAGFEKRLDESLSRMKTSHVDLYYLHMLRDPSLLTPALLKKVEQLKKDGKLKHFGFSCHNDNVAELLQVAARTPWVESVMFRYNFRKYGDKALNDAMDACVKAGVGLIAMKTQGSAVSFEKSWQKFQQTGKWNKFQAVLKAVWADERISAAVSDMDSLEKIRENAAAAVDPSKLGSLDLQELQRYAMATRSVACDGCGNLCEPALSAPIPVATTLRYLMYHDSYGKRDEARALYRALPDEAKRTAGLDFSAGSAACPNGLDIDEHMARAARILA